MLRGIACMHACMHACGGPCVGGESANDARECMKRMGSVTTHGRSTRPTNRRASCEAGREAAAHPFMHLCCCTTLQAGLCAASSKVAEVGGDAVAQRLQHHCVSCHSTAAIAVCVVRQELGSRWGSLRVGHQLLLFAIDRRWQRCSCKGSYLWPRPPCRPSIQSRTSNSGS